MKSTKEEGAVSALQEGHGRISSLLLKPVMVTCVALCAFARGEDRHGMRKAHHSLHQSFVGSRGSRNASMLSWEIGPGLEDAGKGGWRGGRVSTQNTQSAGQLW